MGKEQIDFEEAARWCQTSASKIWEGAESGLLLADKSHSSQGARVRLDDLERWAKCEGLAFEQPEPLEEPEPIEESEVIVEDESDELALQCRAEGPSDWGDFQERLLDRLEHAQRRAVVLELQLRQTQKLLCDSNDNKHEHESRIKEAEAKAEAANSQIEKAKEEAELADSVAEEAKQEAARAKIELETLKTEMALKEAQWAEMRKPWYKKLFRSTPRSQSA